MCAHVCRRVEGGRARALRLGAGALKLTTRSGSGLIRTDYGGILLLFLGFCSSWLLGSSNDTCFSLLRYVCCYSSTFTLNLLVPFRQAVLLRQPISLTLQNHLLPSFLLRIIHLIPS